MRKYNKIILLLLIVLLSSCDLEVEPNKSDLAKPNEPSQMSAVLNGTLASFSAAYDELAAMDGIYTDQYDASQGYSYMQEIELKQVNTTNVMTLESWKNLLLALDGLEVIRETTASNFTDSKNYRFAYHFLYASWLELVARSYESVPRVGTKAKYTPTQARQEALSQLNTAESLGYNPSSSMQAETGFSLESSLAVKTLNTLRARIQIQLGQDASTSLSNGLLISDNAFTWKYTAGSSVGIYQYINATSPTYLDIQQNGAVGNAIKQASSYNELFAQYAAERDNLGTRWQLNYFNQFGQINFVSGVENELLRIETGSNLNTRKSQLGNVMTALGLSASTQSAIQLSITDNTTLMNNLSIVQGLGLIGQGQRFSFLVRTSSEPSNTWKLPNSFNF
jgi:hypothetical protein